jgi:hypothetical protein
MLVGRTNRRAFIAGLGGAGAPCRQAISWKWPAAASEIALPAALTLTCMAVLALYF